MEKIQFAQLELSKEIQKAVQDMGFEEATAIQTASIPLIMEGKDIIGHSQTGTGKTAAFGIPAIEMVNPDIKALQVLILCPTRELAVQASDEMLKFAKYKHGIKILPIYGGQPIERQLRSLKTGIQIVIGTPGRVMDHMRRGTLKMDKVKMIILDEADEMLNMGFREDIETILKDVPEQRQTVLFSATMSPDILRITKLYQTDPQMVKINHKQLTVPSIEQYYYEVKSGKKLEVLSILIDMYNPRLSLIFCNTKKMVDILVGELQSRGYSVDGLHGDMKQATRTRVMERFKRGKIDILVATDVAARGIDVDDIEAVFNYDLPQDEEYYVHRIGRTGRAGKSGKSYTFVSGRKEIFELRDIQRYANTKITLQKVPTLSDAEETRTNRFIEEVKRVMDSGELESYNKIFDKLTEDEYTSVDVASALIKMVLEKDKQAAEAKSEDDFADTGAEHGMVRLFINVGRTQKVSAKDVLGAITNETGIHGKMVGKIDIYDKYTFIEVPEENAQDVMSIMKNSQIKGRRINIEPAKGKGSR